MHQPALRRLVVAAVLVVALVTPAAAKVVCPGPDAVYGIDVSEFQGNIDWAKVKAGGKDFAIIRVSDGTGHLDPDFAKNWAGAQAAGVIRGVYQFFEPSQDAVAQANLLLQHMGKIGQGDLPPMIDVEVADGQSPAVITAKIHQWVDTVETATGRKALIYTGGWFWNPSVASGDFVNYPLVDSYYCNNCCPNIAVPWNNWTMWQYSSTGAVPGISGNVDLDRYDGTLADLNKLAGGSVDWAASYVKQSWPLASSSLTMTVNQSLPAKITMKNIGAKAWDAKTFLGTTQPRDRKSVFVAADWTAPNRAASCVAGAAPGQPCDFDFTWHAPEVPGDYHEFFSFVEEGVAWFSDAGQGGPADNVIEAWIHVVAADYRGTFSAQSYPAVPMPVTAHVGETLSGWVELKNEGTLPWKAGTTMLAPTPRDKPSSLVAPDWLSPTRVSTLSMDVAPGAVGRFAWSLRGAAEGDTVATFTLVEEGVTWFADAPKGGGPADDAIRVHVVVTAAAAVDGGSPHGDAAAPAHDAGAGAEGGSDGPSLVGQLSGGCTCAVNRRSAPGGAPLALGVLALALVGRSRRRLR